MLSHNDFTVGELSVDIHILSMGIFLSVKSPSLTCFRKEISASSKMLTKSSQGLTRPPLVRADMKLFGASVDFMFCNNVCSSSLHLSFFLLHV